MANYKVVIPYFLKKEGGLSRATTDTASRNPSPCVYNGVTGWHTNKGVTWSTFVSNANKLGYAATCANFIAMPANIWGLIFKKSYWDYWRSDDIPQQSIADFMTWSVWGSGAGGSKSFLSKFLKTKGIQATTYDQIRSAMLQLAEKNEKQTWLDLIQYRSDWYVTLNQPANLKGWRNSLNAYREWGLNTYTFKKKKRGLIFAALAMLGGSIFMIRELNPKPARNRN
jgi:lysozyme family protein